MQSRFSDRVGYPCRDRFDEVFIYVLKSAVFHSLQGYFHSISEHFSGRSILHLLDEFVNLRCLDAFKIVTYGHIEYETVRIAESEFFGKDLADEPGFDIFLICLRNIKLC